MRATGVIQGVRPDGLQSKLERAMHHEYGKLSCRLSYSQLADRRVYSWRRYLVRLKGFRMMRLGDFLANFKSLPNHVAIVDPSCSIAFAAGLAQGPAPGHWLLIATEEFAAKCLFLGLPDISSMTFKMPQGWSMHHPTGLELDPTEVPHGR